MYIFKKQLLDGHTLSSSKRIW